MKKLFVVIVGLFFSCVVNAMDMPEIRSIYDERPINWKALEVALDKINNGDCTQHVRTMILHEWAIKKHSAGQPVSLARMFYEIAAVSESGIWADKCLPSFGNRNGDWLHRFVIDYAMALAEAFENDASKSCDAVLYLQITNCKDCAFTEKLGYCLAYPTGADCVGFMEHVSLCKDYLEKLYGDKLQNSSGRQQKRYKCVLDLIQTWQLDLPSAKMEEVCR